MAYDTMGNYIGDTTAVDPYAQETEEERRLRLQREAEAAAQAAGPVTAPVAPTIEEKMQPVKQTITTDPRTGRQTMKIEGSVQDLSPANPNTPTVMPPNYDRMLQAESGNRDFDAQGRPITSPKGAMFKAQVMPTTAQNPGYGIRPAMAKTPDEYNRVGQEYYQAMLNKYPGQPELARAAYNAGPGRVDDAIRQSMLNGGSPMDYLPKETRGYVQKTGTNVRMEGGKLKVDANAPQQQAQPQQPPGQPAFLPEAAQGAPSAVEPQNMAGQAPPSPYSLAPTQPSTGIQVAGLTTTTNQPGALPEAQQRFQDIQDDPSALLQYRNDTNIPEDLRRRAGERASELLNAERNRTRAEARRDELIANGDGKAIANAMQGRGAKGEEGSWLKFVFLHALDPNLANAEAEKLGIMPNKYEQATLADDSGNVKAVEVKKSPSGKILEATHMDGTPLTSAEMSKLSVGAKMDIVGGTYVNDKTGEVGRVVSDPKTGITYVQTDQGRKPMAGFRPQASAGSLEQQNVTQQQQLTNKLHYEPAIAAASKGASTLAEYNALNGTNFAIAGRDSLGRPLVVDQRSGQMLQAPAGQAPAAPAPAPAAPAPTQTAPTQTAPAAPPAAGPVAPAPIVSTTGSTPAEIDAAKKRAAEQEAANLKVGTAEREEFVKHKATVQDAAEAGRQVSQVTRTQMSDLMQDPVIIGIMNGSGTQYAAAGKLIREMASGAYSDDESGKRLADDIRGLSITQPQKDALSRYAQLNTQINRATLKANSGGGGVSNAEQAANKAANMTNIGDLTPFAALNGLGRRQYQGDLTQEKAAMMATGQYQTRSQFDQAWQKTEDQRIRQYDAIYRERLNLIKPFAEKANANPNDAQAQQRYRDAAIHSFRVYPNPEYTAGSGWSFKTKQSKMAAMAAVAGDR
jgi:soluble lytic murein transglycosylase